MRTAIRLRGVFLLGTLVIAGCSGGSGGSTGLGGGQAARIAKIAGDSQSATVGTAVAIPPAVVITDASGTPVAGVGVTFQVTAGGGTVTPTTSVLSGGNGVAATAGWTLGAAPGANTLTAAAPGLAGSPVTFTATGKVASGNATVQVGNGSQLVFVPDHVTIPVGGTVTWQWNSGTIAHNVSTSNGSPTIPGTPTRTTAPPFSFGPVQFNAPGTYRFYCSVHAGPNDTSGMVGTITVQ